MNGDMTARSGSDPWFDFLAGQVQAADPDTRRCGITGLDRLRAVQELQHYADEALEWAEVILPAASEIWPEWPGEEPDMAKGPKGGSGAHGKAGGADKGKSDIDRTGKFGKHHGGNLSGNAKGGKAGGGKK